MHFMTIQNTKTRKITPVHRPHFAPAIAGAPAGVTGVLSTQELRRIVADMLG